MNDEKIIIYGEPVAKGRPRFQVRGKFVQTYTPSKTLKEEKRIKEELKKWYKGEPIECPLAITLSFNFGIPKSYTKKKVKELEEKLWVHSKKPDCDNLAKLVLDAMNGIIYKDDCQIYSLHITKRYTHVDTQDPCIEITFGGLI